MNTNDEINIKPSGCLRFLFIIGWLISFLQPLNILTSEMGTCTQGSTDEYTFTNLFSVVILFFFILFLRRDYKYFYQYWWLGIFHILTVLSYIYVVPKYLLYTTIKGISLCIVKNGIEYLHTFNLSDDAWQEAFDISHILFAPIETLTIFIILFYIYKMVQYRFMNKNL